MIHCFGALASRHGKHRRSLALRVAVAARRRSAPPPAACRTTILTFSGSNPTEPTNSKGPARGPYEFGGERGITRAAPSPYGSPSLRDDDLHRLRRLVEPPFWLSRVRIQPTPQIQKAPHGGLMNLAEREGFEPSIEFPLYTLSRGAPSATRPSLRNSFLHHPPLPRIHSSPTGSDAAKMRRGHIVHCRHPYPN